MKAKKFDHITIEAKWRQRWEKESLYTPDINAASDPFYNLWMFPYPSAEGLHAGHAFASTGSDIIGRFNRMNGRDVFQPMVGYDSFGIHAENYALQIGEHPMTMLERVTKHYSEQMKNLGHGYDWTRSVTTSDIEFYRWTQWIFVQLFKAGLAYRKTASVNWCPSCKTVLSDEQVVTPAQAGKQPKDAAGEVVVLEEGMRVCERCGSLVEEKKLEQWFFRITDYADRLLENLEKIDWSERVVTAQRNWIGRSKGADIKFKIKNEKLNIEVFTTRPDTVFGATFIVVSPEYARENLMKLIPQDKKGSVSKYIDISLSKTNQDRLKGEKEKTGVDTGVKALNPFTKTQIPVFVADYVLSGYGSGAIMGVPAHDERDFAFAKKYELPIRKVIDWDTEVHSLVIKESVDEQFVKEIGTNSWYYNDYEDWGYGIVVPAKDADKYALLVQKHLKEGPWYVDSDGALKAVIFKDRVFKLPKEKEQAKEYGRSIGIPEKQLDWQQENTYGYCFAGYGKLVNSGDYNGLESAEATQKMLQDYKDVMQDQTQYHLRDWLISRQRYWGTPIPMIHCPGCAKEGKSWFDDNADGILHTQQDDWEAAGWYPEENLPLELPFIDDYKPQGMGRGPLDNHPEFYETACPACGGKAKRETDVMDTFVDSSWYFLRYPSVDAEVSKKAPFDPVKTKKWLPVDLYFGGAEHSVLHLMYARFVTMALHDLNHTDFEEPFPRFFAHGLMIKDGAKMSKSRGNVVTPDEYIEKYGADTLRLYLMFMGPMDGYPDFRDTGIEGMRRFTEKLWGLLRVRPSEKEIPEANLKKIEIKMHKTVKKVTEDVENFRYNTAIAAVMEYVNVLRDATKDLKPQTEGESAALEEGIWKNALRTLTLLIAPFTPHLAEEVWSEVLGEDFSVHKAVWPVFDEQLAKEERATVVIQVNGKLRHTISVQPQEATDESKMVEMARSEPAVSKWLEGKEYKSIFVPGKLVNFVVKP